MIPRIFDRYSTGFLTRGLGTLKDAIFAPVREEKNGEYSLYLEYPLDGPKIGFIKEENIIYASTPRGAQPFRIYYTEIDTVNGIIAVYANHIFYLLLLLI